MRIVNTENLKIGMKLGKPVYTSNGNLLLNMDVELSNSFIKSLKEKNIPAVYINDELSADIDIDNAIDLEVKIKAVETVKHVFKDMRVQAKGNKKKQFVTSRSYQTVRDSINVILENLLKNNTSLYNMVEMMSTDLSSYIHSVNVAVLAILTGKGIGFNRNQLIDLGTGALMHDIGMSQVPLEIINKSDKLSREESENIKSHPTYGYQMIKHNSGISAFVKTIVLMHHERLDGSGYPMGLDASRINKYVRIVSICDMFDSAISDNVYSNNMPIYKALEFIESQVRNKLDEDIYRVFLKNISIYPRGIGVLLNTGEKGLVIENYASNPTRPKIRIIRKKDGSFNPGFKIVDLMEDLTLFVEDTCDVSV